MWELFPSKIKYTLSVIAMVFLFLFFNNLIGLSFFSSISSTVTILTFISWLFGKYLWKYVYIDFFKNKFCPDFNGEWVGNIESNFNGGTSVEFPISIEADFFSIKMKAKTTIGRTYGNYCRVLRAEDDSFELEYMFKGYNDTPSETDAPFYEGAARLRVIDISTMEMKGVFWTNRCWHQGRNTAGIIRLTKKS